MMGEKEMSRNIVMAGGVGNGWVALALVGQRSREPLGGCQGKANYVHAPSREYTLGGTHLRNDCE